MPTGRKRRSERARGSGKAALNADQSKRAVTVEETADLAGVLPTLAAPMLASARHAAMLRRAWALLLIDAAERGGLIPIASDEVHALAYLGDCLAPVYGIPALDGVLLRRAQGPLFPDLQWDIDRLWAMGLMEMVSLPERVGMADTARRVGYGVTTAGSARARELRDSPFLDRLFTFFVALATALARVPHDQRLSAVDRDLTYAGAGAVGTLVTYGDWVDGNSSIATVNAFAEAAPVAGMVVHPWERLAMYLSLLRHRIAFPAPTRPA